MGAKWVGDWKKSGHSAFYIVYEENKSYRLGRARRSFGGSE